MDRPDAALVRQEFTYSEGRLYRTRAHRGHQVGSEAGTLHRHGYVKVRVGNGFRKQFPAHQIVWLWHMNIWPTGEIDHINGNKSDNRIENLRVVSRRTNSENKHKANPNNKNKMLGVHEHGNGYFRARIGVNGVTHYLGSFKTAELAQEAYLAAKTKMHAGMDRDFWSRPKPL